MLFKIKVQYSDNDTEFCFAEAETVKEASLLVDKHYKTVTRKKYLPVTIVNIEEIGDKDNPVIRKK